MPGSSLTRAQWRQIAAITGGAVALFVLARNLPTGTNLAHADFQAPGGNAIQACDPANPAFLPVIEVKSPVTMTIATDVSPAVGRPMRVAMTLRTVTGRPVGPEDLLVTHEHRLHILAVDPGLRDYQHLHPVPGSSRGAWEFSMTPRAAGLYRFFADFMPAATARGLYASADLTVPGRPERPTTDDNWTAVGDGLRYTLTPGAPIRARDVVTLTLTITSATVGEPVMLEPVMGAYAHLVAFDEARSGFAHIHPQPADVGRSLDAHRPQLTFKVQISRPGRYVVWSQIKTRGAEHFAPFWIEVAP